MTKQEKGRKYRVWCPTCKDIGITTTEVIGVRMARKHNQTHHRGNKMAMVRHFI